MSYRDPGVKSVAEVKVIERLSVATATVTSTYASVLTSRTLTEFALEPVTSINAD